MNKTGKARDDLMIAISEGQLDKVKSLIAEGVDYTVPYGKSSVLDIAASFKQTEILHYFIGVLGMDPKIMHTSYSALDLEEIYAKGLRKREYLRRAQGILEIFSSVIPPLIVDYAGLGIEKPEDIKPEDICIFWVLRHMNQHESEDSKPMLTSLESKVLFRRYFLDNQAGAQRFFPEGHHDNARSSSRSQMIFLP